MVFCCISSFPVFLLFLKKISGQRSLGRFCFTRHLSPSLGEISSGSGQSLIAPMTPMPGFVKWILAIYLAASGSYSILIRVLLGVPLWVPTAIMVTIGLASLLTHRLGHAKWTRQWYQAHAIGHHLRAHPPSRFESDVYVPNPSDPNLLSTWLYVFAGVTALFCVNLAHPNGLSLCQMMVAMVPAWAVLFWEDILHSEVHKTRSRLDNFGWYQKVKQCHRIHHKHTEVNLAVSALFFDWFLGTLRTGQ